jgi:predicted dehydrogenase
MTAPDARVTAVIVGAGLMGRWHAAAIRRAGVSIAAIVDENEPRATALAARFGNIPTHRTLAEALDRHRPAAVHVCTPLETHVTLSVTALVAGAHVLCEKPLASTQSETRTLIDAAENAGRLICPVHQFLFQDGFRRAMEWRSRAGALLHIETIASSAGAAGRGDDEQRALVADILPHPLSIAARLTDAPLAAVAWQVQAPRPGELVALGAIGETIATMRVSTHGRPTWNAVTIVAEQGTAHVNLFHGFAVFEGAAVSRSRKIVHPLSLAARTGAAALWNLGARLARSESAYPGLRALVGHFYRAVRGGVPPISRAEVLDVAAARDAILASV